MKFITMINLFLFIILTVSSVIVTHNFTVPISVGPQKLDENVSIGTPEEFTISIKDTGLGIPFDSDQLNLRYKVNGLNGTWFKQPNGSSLESLTTKLAIGEAEFIQVTLNVSKDTIPGKYDGVILLLDSKSDSDDRPYKIIQTSLKINRPASNVIGTGK
jgi:hypothetical protein